MSEHDSSWASGAPDDRAAGQSPRNQHEQQDTTNEWSAPSSPESATTPSSPPGATPYQGGTYQPGQTSSFPSYQGSGYGNPPPEPSAAPTSAPGAPGAGHPGSSYTGGPVWPGATSGYPGSAAGGYPAPVGHGGEPKPGIGRLGRIAVLGLAALFLALCSGLTGGFIARSTDDPRPATTITRNAAPALERSSVAAVAAKVQPSVVDINTGSGEGSGVVLSADGAILTNNHVVEGARGNTVDVTLSDGKTAKATIVGTDPKGDLAVIKAQNVAGFKPDTFCALMTARSPFGSVPTIVALAVLPSLKVTSTVLPRAPSTTWLLVRIAPSAESTTPDPSPEPVLMSTTLGCTFAATAATDERSSAGAALRVIVVAGRGSSVLRAMKPPVRPEHRARKRAASPSTAMRPSRPMPGFGSPPCPTGAG